MKAVNSRSGPIYFNDQGLQEMLHLLERKRYSRIFVLVDENTARDCLPVFKQWMNSAFVFHVIRMPEGEFHKNITTSVHVWEELSEAGADRKSLLINLGGGVVTDLGGFIGATFRRGIDFLNVPTSLLAMVDAALGGKTGVDLGVLKNQIGVIVPPVMIWILPEFLKTLPERQRNNGYAEMLKHGLIADAKYWEELICEDVASDLTDLIHRSVEIKMQIVDQDLRESGIRKTLNFGHTIGHAIESYFLAHREEIVYHGEAIAAGMILEAYISNQLTGLPGEELESICKEISARYPKLAFQPDDISAIMDLLRYDKKNTHGQVLFVLLERIGAATIDVVVSNDLLDAAFVYYIES